MYLIQIFLPLYDNNGKPLSQRHFHQTTAELSSKFGGLTAYTRSPAEGYWKAKRQQIRRDDMVIYEVMSARLARRWWTLQKQTLEKRFRQEQILVRAQQITVL